MFNLKYLQILENKVHPVYELLQTDLNKLHQIS